MSKKEDSTICSAREASDLLSPSAQPIEDSTGLQRRKFLKGAGLALSAVYLAPATLDLLLAKRATAQSNCPPCANFRITNNSYAAGIGILLYTDCDNNTIDEGPEIAQGGSHDLSALVNTQLVVVDFNSGQNIVDEIVSPCQGDYVL